jgi:hypothetical protein
MYVYLHLGCCCLLGEHDDVIESEEKAGGAVGQHHARVSVAPIPVARPLAVLVAVVAEHVQLYPMSPCQKKTKN